MRKQAPNIIRTKNNRRIKKVAYVVVNLNINGVATVVLNYSTHLGDNYSIDIFSGKPISETNRRIIENHKNVRLIETPTKNIKNYIKYISFLKRRLTGYDITHIHGNSRLIAPELLIAKTNKNNLVIAHSHSESGNHIILHKLLRPVFRFLYDCGIACSNNAGKWMFGGDNFQIINNGLLVDKYAYKKAQRTKIRHALALNENTKIIGHVGNFSKEKNYKYIIKIFDKICETRKDFVLVLIGKYSNNIKLKKYIETSRNYHKIYLLGTKKRIENYYNIMDCFVFPSKHEGLGIAVIEAQLNGLMCYVSNTLPNETRISDKIQFLPIRKKEIPNWANAIIRESDQFSIKHKTSTEKPSWPDISQSITELKNIYEKGSYE